jgi:hypothetical protein
LDWRRSRLLDRRFTLSGLLGRKRLKDFDWTYNHKGLKRDILELATMKFIDENEGALFIGSPGIEKMERFVFRRLSLNWPCSAATRCSTVRRTF